MKVKSVLALVLATMTFGVVASQGFGAVAQTWTVDDDAGYNNASCKTVAQGGTLQCPTITKAITKASAGDTIIVKPGTYDENLLVNKKLTIKGSRVPPDLLTCDGNRTNADDTKWAYVESTTPAAPIFNIQANGVTIQNLVIQNAFDDGVSSGSGIFTAPTTSLTTIKSNLIQDNNMGIYLNSAGTTTVNGNCIRDNNVNAGVAASAGNGIYSDQGLKSATISQNRFFDHASDDIVLTGTVNPAVLSTTVSGNISNGSAGFLTALVSKTTTVSGNIVHGTTDASADYSAAILMWGTNTGFSIKGNIIEDGAGSGIVFDQINGQYLGGCCGAQYDGPNTGGTVSGNIVNRMGGDGLYAIDESSFGAVTNSLEKTVVSSNIFGSNTDDGIHIAKQSLPNLTLTTKNTFTANIATGSGTHDCHDSNNKDVWTGTTNLGHTVNKTGLCFPGDVVSGPQNHTAF